jgi:hypothetical protein
LEWQLSTLLVGLKIASSNLANEPRAKPQAPGRHSLRRRWLVMVSGKCSQEHIPGMHQVVPGGLKDLVPLQLQIVVFFKLLDVPLEFGKAASRSVQEFEGKNAPTRSWM